jgi:hypothetical protein
MKKLKLLTIINNHIFIKKTIMKKLIYFLAFATSLLIALSCNDPDEFIGGDNAIRGCINQAAVNYDNKATIDDGSCVVTGKNQNTIAAKFTATWCGPCGTNTSFNNLYNEFKPVALHFTLQVNDVISGQFSGVTPIMNGFKSYWGIGSLSTPSFAANDEFVLQNIAQARNAIESKIEQDPKAGLGLKWTRGAGPNKGKINLNVYVEFFETVSGKYNLGVYYIANELIATQNVGGTQTPDFQHKLVMLGEATGAGMYGTEISEGQINSGDVFRFSRVLTPPNGIDMGKVSVVAILWKLEGNKFVFENCTLN